MCNCLTMMTTSTTLRPFILDFLRHIQKILFKKQMKKKCYRYLAHTHTNIYNLHAHHTHLKDDQYYNINIITLFVRFSCHLEFTSKLKHNLVFHQQLPLLWQVCGLLFLQKYCKEKYQHGVLTILKLILTTFKSVNHMPNFID